MKRVAGGAVAFSAITLALVLAGCTRAAPLPAKAVALNRAGAEALGEGDLELAQARIALALEYSPRFTEAWVNLGLVELRRGDLARAERDFAKARDLNPDLPAPHHALGLLAERQGRGGDAERHYRSALKVDPGFAPARVNLGRLLFARGDVEEAREHFLRTTQVAPEYVAGWAGLCESLLRLDREDDARDALAAARRRFRDDASLALLDARLLLRRRAFARAEERLAPIARGADQPRAAEALAWLAVARLGEGDAEGAADIARSALARDPLGEVARYALRTAIAQESAEDNAR